MAETKASRLKKLSKIVAVPKFFVTNNNLKFNERNNKKYIIRSSSKHEDQGQFSQAGQFKTIGPVTSTEIKKSVKKILSYKKCNEAIIQEFVEQGEKGVIFCFSENNIFVEYSNVKEGVTSGKIKPFIAILPNNINKYKKLQLEINKIFKKFGPSDIEFIGLKNPQFVQVRPITKVFEYDKNLEKLKMKIQEFSVDSWIENDFCKIIPERVNKSKDFISKYLIAVKNVFKNNFNKEIEIPKKPIIKISDQYFMEENFSESIIPAKLDLLKFSFKFNGILKKIKFELDEIKVQKLIENSILLSYGYSLFKRNDILILRDKYQKKINRLLVDGDIKENFSSKNKLAFRIKLNLQEKFWEEIGCYKEEGVTVVDGDFDTGPFFKIKNIKEKIPEDVIVVTDELYPEIGKYIKKIKGIICKNGSMNSHIAILAREYNIPLKIQTSIENL